MIYGLTLFFEVVKYTTLIELRKFNLAAVKRKLTQVWRSGIMSEGGQKIHQSGFLLRRH